MVEELYVIHNGQRHRLDLNTPSGISLNFKSNIFGDLSKITCSYSYSFKLPLTANNRRVLDNAEDVRHTSSVLRKRLEAEFVQNGIPLFSKANLYIDVIDTTYNAVLTWGCVDGLQTLKDNDCSIRKLPLYAEPVFGPASDRMSEWKNSLDFAKPRYNAGLPYVTKEGWTDRYNTRSFFPTPVVPVFRLIQLINKTFGTAFNFGTQFSYGETSANHSIIDFGVLPCVTALQSEEMKERNKYKSHLGSFLGGRFYEIDHVLLGPTNDTCASPILSITRDIASGKSLSLKVTSQTKVQFSVRGRISMRLSCDWKVVDQQRSWITSTAMLIEAKNGQENKFKKIVPKLHVYGYANGKSESLASVEGFFDDEDMCWYFDFDPDYGSSPLEINASDGCEVFLALDTEDAPDLQMHNNTIWRMVTFIPSKTPEGISYDKQEDNAGSYEIDLRSNLPDISCMTLVKSLYYMLGAFPVVSNNDEIIPCYYTDIKKNLDNALIVDWSSKVINGFASLPSKTSFQVNGFAQRNYFLMKNDSLESTSSSDEADVYADGKGVIPVENMLLEKSKTIVQLPFNAPYIKNNKDPFRDTGSTFKFWYCENQEFKVKEGKPCFGVIVPMVQKTTNSSGELVPTGEVFQSMEVWNSFANIESDPSYAYLQKIMQNPVIITENMRLNEFDLSSLDYTVPVYLDKYGAYFAIVSIIRDSKGICKCELLKLPQE